MKWQNINTDDEWKIVNHTKYAASKFDSCVAVALTINDKVIGIIPRPANLFALKWHYPHHWDHWLDNTNAIVVPVHKNEFNIMFRKFIKYVLKAPIKKKAEIINEMIDEGMPLSL